MVVKTGDNVLPTSLKDVGQQEENVMGNMERPFIDQMPVGVMDITALLLIRWLSEEYRGMEKMSAINPRRVEARLRRMRSPSALDGSKK